MLTTEQRTTLAAALRAEINVDVVAALAIRNDTALTAWCNTASAVDAWISAMSGADLFDQTDIAKFDNLTAGKRDAWRLMLDFAPIDFTRQKKRKAVQDIWGNTDSIPVLQACIRKATVGENYLGGSSATTNTVTALKLNYEGSISTEDVGRALNDNP